MRIVSALPQRLCDRHEGLRRLPGERLPGLTWPQPLGVRERPLEPIARRRGNRKLHTSGRGVAGRADILPLIRTGRFGLNAGSRRGCGTGGDVDVEGLPDDPERPARSPGTAYCRLRRIKGARPAMPAALAAHDRLRRRGNGRRGVRRSPRVRGGRQAILATSPTCMLRRSSVRYWCLHGWSA